MTFPARREPWLLPVLIFDGAITLGIAFWMASEASRRNEPIFWIVCLAMVLALPLAAWVLLGVRYEITDRELITHTGPFRSRIPLNHIDEVFPTQGNPIAPAWAQDRLQILFRSGERVRTGVVNPADRTAFLERLSAADSGLVRNGERVQRRYS